MAFEVPTWEEIYELLLRLADRVRRDGFRPDVIVGVSRGGWLPARVMSDLLENPELANVKAEFYPGVGKAEGEPVITQPVSAPVRGKRVLVVDDVVDTGKSLRLVRSDLVGRGAAEVRIAAIYHKPWSLVTPDYYERETRSWIVFPWEGRETVRSVVEQYRRRGKTAEQAAEKLVSSGMDRGLVERFLKEMAESPKSPT